MQKANFDTPNTGIFHKNIEKITESNKYFRKVLSTTPNMQLVVMSLKPKEDIGMEIHPYTTQFIRVESGTGVAIVDDKKYKLSNGSAIIIPLNSKHNIVNTSKTEPLKIYTIYSPPNHPSDRVDIKKRDD